MRWNKEKNAVEIDWKEGKGKNSSPVFHSISKTPVKLQLHPKTGAIIRAHFLGARPHWIARYTLSKRYRSTELVGENGPGWWIANWSDHPDRPLSSPSTKGMLTEWLNKVSDVFEKEKERLFESIETVEVNLLFHHEEFEQYGIFFKPESIKRDGGAMCLGAAAVPIDEEGQKADKSKHENFLSLVDSLIMERELPEVDELLLEVEEVEEPDFTIDLEQEEQLIEEEYLYEEDPEHFFMMEEAARDEEEFQIIQLEEEELAITEEHVQVNDEIEPVVYEELPDTDSSEPEIEVLTEVTTIPATPIEEVPEVIEKSVATKETDSVKPLVAEKINRRENIVAGQTLLF